MSERAFHLTAKRNLGAIMRWGLIPRDTTLHNYPDIPSNRGVEAVYVKPVERGRWYGCPYDEPLAIVEVDVSGLRTEPDAEIPSAVRVLERIPPERIVIRRDLMEAA